MQKEKYNIILADDHEILLDSLADLINSQHDLKVIAKATNGKQLIDKVEETMPDLCIVDMDMPGMNGLQASEILLKQLPELKIIILTMHNEKSLVKKMMNLGVKAYLLKTCDKDEFIFAIHQVLKNKTYFSDNIIETVVKNETDKTSPSDIQKIASLSSREKEIIRFLCQGLNNKQIGDKIFVSHKTVDNHRTNIMRKLDVHNVVELIRFSLKNNLAD
ncbi:MAG: response regulator transcription factor [Bacteroidota bacterium]